MDSIKSIRENYEKFGVDGYYKNNADTYSNPHIKIIQNLMNTLTERLDLSGQNILDLCCGTGEITSILNNLSNLNSENIKDIKEIKGLDPYTYKIYTERTDKYCYPFDFKDIATGKLTENFDTVICSFGLHLCEKSLLPTVLWQLSRISRTLIIITPNKNPNCSKSEWVLLDEIIQDRVKLRIYQH